MITYKNFKMYFCSENEPYENLQECGIFVHTIADGTRFSGYYDDAEFEAELASNIPQYKEITSVFFGVYSGDEEFYNRITPILPLTVRNQEINNTGSTVRLKLVADNGSYCIGNYLINAGDPIGSSGGSLYRFSCYNADNIFIGDIDGFPPVLQYGWGMNIISGYDGIVKSTDRLFVFQCSKRFNGQFDISPAVRTISPEIAEWYNSIPILPATPTDPYAPGGETEPGGGEGDFDNTSDPIDFPNIPTLSAVDTGFITLFNPTLDQLKNLSSYMWSDLFDVEGWKKLFANPMDAILGLTIVPVAVPDAGTGTVTVGNISTGITMTKAAGQYVEVDCGTLNVNEYWGAYLDYDPYTKAEIYLPFIGIHALSTDDIMNKPVHVKYHIDLLSGACCAYVKCGGSVLYSFVGQCSCSVPVTSTDWSNIINGALSIAGAIGSMVASNGATAPMGIGTIASAAVNSLKPNVEKSGSMGGMGGMLGVQQPYIILTRPRQALPSRLNTYSGYPSFMTKILGELSGYTIVDDIHLENIPATGSELSEIEALLKDGVIL